MLCSVGFGFLKTEIRKFQGNYLEIGIFDGDLISSLARENADKMFYGIDPFIEDGYTEKLTNVLKGNTITSQKDTALSKLSKCKNLAYFIETSEDFSKHLTDEECDKFNISCVLIDGSHWYKDVVIDYDIAVRLIKDKKGFIVFDDVNVPEVEQAWNTFLEKYKSIITKTSVILTVNNKSGITVAYLNGGENNA